MRAAPWHWCGTHSFRRFPTSSTVGYQQYALSKGVNILTPVFESTSNEKVFDLQDLKLVGNVQGDGTEVLRVLNANGVSVTEYYWYTPDGWFYDDSYKAGWYTASEEYVENVTYSKGSGLYLFIDHTESVQLQSSGNVVADITEISIETGVNVTGNATPLKYNIQNLKLSDTASGDGTEVLRILNANGVSTTEYYWYTPDGWFYDDSYVPGWYTAAEDLADIEIAPGQGMYIYKDSSVKVKLILPNPLAK